MFRGSIDAIFKHDNGFLIIDYKTDKNPKIHQITKDN